MSDLRLYATTVLTTIFVSVLYVLALAHTEHPVRPEPLKWDEIETCMYTCQRGVNT